MKKRKSLNQKAQTTIFIILTIMIIIIISILFILKPNKQSQISLAIQPLYSLVQSCVDETSKQAIVYVSERGGYYELPENSLDDLTSYYLYDGRNIMPTKEKIQQEISLYVEDNLDKCVSMATEFSDFEISSSDLNVITKIKDEVEIEIVYPLFITKGEQTYDLENFNANVPIRLGVIYDSVEQIMQEQVKDSAGLDSHYIHQVSRENDIYTRMVSFSDNVIIFTIRDENSKIDNQAFVFIFANKYSEEEL